MTTPTQPPSEQPHIGPYQVIERISSGGMGTTYLARREGETTPRVLKLGHTGVPMASVIDARLGREAAVGARLRHPNVAALVDAGVTDLGRRYLVFEYVAGPRLTEVLESWLARGVRPPLDVAVGLALQLLDGLHHIHEARDEAGALLYAVHRDVGPNNVMLELSGVPKLIDLGLVRDARSDWRTESRVVVGTAQYVAPEIASGGAKYADRRADLYSMGVLLYELLLAEPIFPVGTGLAAMLPRLIEPRHVPLSQRRADVPRALEAVVMRALATNPDERWPHAVAFSEALRSACAVAGRGRIAAFLSPELEAHRAATAHRTMAAPSVAAEGEVAPATSLGSSPTGTQLVRRRPGHVAEPEVVVSPEAAFSTSEMLREVVPTRVLARRARGAREPVEVRWPRRWVLGVGAAWTVVCVGATWAVTTDSGARSAAAANAPVAGVETVGLVAVRTSSHAPSAGAPPGAPASASAAPVTNAEPAPSTVSAKRSDASAARAPSRRPSPAREAEVPLPAGPRAARELRVRLDRGEALQPLVEAARALAESHGADHSLVGLIRRAEHSGDRAALDRALRTMEQP